MASQDTIRSYIDEQQPFGPTDAAQIRDADSMAELFDKRNRTYRNLDSRPSILIGRRGSGKTAFLNSLVLNKHYKVVTALNTPEMFANVIGVLRHMGDSPVFVETVAQLWELAIWSVLFQAIRNSAGRLDAASAAGEYLLSLGIAEDMDANVTFRTVIERFSDAPVPSLVDTLHRLKQGDVPFEPVRTRLCAEMQRQKIRAVVLMDSMEDYRPDTPGTDMAMGGLFKCLGAFRTPLSPCDVRFCLPSELYQRLIVFSSNPNKDLCHNLTLHWTAGELVQIAAHRLYIYLELYKPDLFRTVRNQDPGTKAGAAAVLSAVLPDRVVNRIGIAESPLAYVVRHTQLLPRHLLIYLNEIWQRNRRLNGSDVLSERSIRDGILAVEQQICIEIFSAFKHVYPTARNVCARCIPELPLRFSHGMLQNIFNQQGKKAMGTDDFTDFKRLLIEIGAVGRVRGETDKYVEAEFEYTVPHSLQTGTDDELCLHPVFSQCYSARLPKPGKTARVIYPYGSDIDGEDWRDSVM